MGKLNIALDGPAGAGKSTIAKRIAAALKIHYLDTGAMYRAFAYKVIKDGLDTSKGADVLPVIKKTDVSVIYDENDAQRVFVNGEDVTDLIRTQEIGKGASDVAVFPEVRIKLVEIQREVANKYDVVMDGRDIGTFVLPATVNKFFLTASIKERARRRYCELIEKGVKSDIKEIEKEITSRDKNDTERKFAPLKMAEDALLVDTTEMTADEVTGFILERIKRD